jgi:N-acyl homoserine lactone hydrolase
MTAGKRMTLHFLSGGRVRMRKATYDPSVPREETFEMPVSCTLIRHGQGNVLFDTGCHPSVADNPEARWGGLARLMTPVMPKGDHVVNSLKCIGVEPDDIDVVICSHLHPDHCGCNAFFKRATFVIHEKEVAAARAPEAEKSGYLAQEWDLPVKIDAFNGERDLFGDNRIVLLPLPGHTPGSTGALVALENSGPFLLASDTVSLRMTLDTGIIPRNTWNAEALAASLTEVGRIEKGGAKVICGHDAAQWDGLRKGLDAYD